MRTAGYDGVSIGREKQRCEGKEEKMSQEKRSKREPLRTPPSGEGRGDRTEKRVKEEEWAGS